MRVSSVPPPSSRRCPFVNTSVSSRIRPANERETSRNDENGWTVGSAGQERDSAIAAGSEIGPENTLKEETPHLLLLIPTRQ